MNFATIRPLILFDECVSVFDVRHRLVDTLWGALNPVTLARLRFRQRGAREHLDKLNLGAAVLEHFEAGAALFAALICKFALVSL